MFPGNERRFSERSSLRVLSQVRDIQPVDSMSVTFEYTPTNRNSPGYIFLLKNAVGEGAFNLTYAFQNGTGAISFAEDGKKILTTTSFPVDETTRRLPVSVKLYVDGDSAVVSIGQHTDHLHDIGLKNRRFVPQLFFGMCGHIIETASFAIGSLSVTLDGREYSFPLDESSGTDVHTADGRVTGEVTNPIWLINRSYHWDNILTSCFSSPAGCVFASGRDEFLIYSRDSLMVFELLDKRLSKNPFAAVEGGWYTRLGMGFYNPDKHSVYAYELDYNRTFMSEIDLENLKCRMLDKGNIDLQMHHHCAAYLPDEGKILIFGGYGNRKYYNDFIEYDIATSRWDTVPFSGDVIPPRLFAAMGMAPDGKSLYVYGGKGNHAGNQDVGVEYYYDLYKINLQKRSKNKLWEQTAPECNRVPTRRMILSPDGGHFYVMAYPEFHPRSELRLYRMSVADGSCEGLADSIPIVSEEIATNSALYFSQSLEKFYCVVQEYDVVPEPGDFGAIC